jgi:FkbM family methyltransferase
MVLGSWQKLALPLSACQKDSSVLPKPKVWIAKLTHFETRSTSDIIATLEHAARSIVAERSPAHLMTMLDQGCWIYGGGGYGKDVAAALRTNGIKLHGIIDQKDPAPGTHSVRQLATKNVSQDEVTGATLIIAIINFSVDFSPILAWAHDIGFKHIIIPAELTDVFGDSLSRYWMTHRHNVIDHLPQLRQFLDLLEDDTSRQIVEGIALYRLTGDVSYHPANELKLQYFPADLPFDDVPQCVIDGGAFPGDMMSSANEVGVNISAWYAFEPDPANFLQLAQAAQNYPETLCALYPCGLGGQLSQVKFSSGQAFASSALKADESADSVTVQIVSVDETLHHVQPTFVKLDIEGAEHSALEGMKQTLRRSRPRLALAIYHKPNDLWELPLYVHELLPDSKLYVRQHGFSGFDTVLYALPR